MKKMIFCICVLVGYLITPVWAGEARTQKTLTEAEQAFRKADIINDGRLDRGEYDIYTYLSFMEMDRDKNKILEPGECLKNCLKNARGQGKAVGAVVDMNSNAMDIDENGYVSDNEFLMFYRDRFDQMDVDSNNFLDKGEFCSVYDVMRPCVVSKLPG